MAPVNLGPDRATNPDKTISEMPATLFLCMGYLGMGDIKIFL